MSKPGTPLPEVTLSEERLWSLIEQRSLPGADQKRIDQRLWDLFGDNRAVLVTDLAGFARQTAAFGIIHFLRVLHEKKKHLLPLVSEHDGVLARIEGDSFFVSFSNTEKALRCAVEMQRTCRRVNEKRSIEEQLLLCVGIGYGRTLSLAPRDLWGVEASAAQLLAQQSAEASQVLVTKAMHDTVSNAEGVEYLELGAAVAGSAQNFRVKF